MDMRLTELENIVGENTSSVDQRINEVVKKENKIEANQHHYLSYQQGCDAESCIIEISLRNARKKIF